MLAVEVVKFKTAKISRNCSRHARWTTVGGHHHSVACPGLGGERFSWVTCHIAGFCRADMTWEAPLVRVSWIVKGLATWHALATFACQGSCRRIPGLSSISGSANYVQLVESVRVSSILLVY